MNTLHFSFLKNWNWNDEDTIKNVFTLKNFIFLNCLISTIGEYDRGRYLKIYMLAKK